jgi:pimeloyl-ACP methyl ester carboxylesterase
VAAVLIGPVYPSDAVVPIFEKRIQTVEEEGMEPMANTIPYAALGKKASALAKSLVRELLMSQGPAGYCSNCRVIVNAKPPDYREIAVPVLILAGDEDKSAPLEGCQKMFEKMGTAKKKLEVMESVGHWHCIEAAEEVVRQIEGFYQEML